MSSFSGRPGMMAALAFAALAVACGGAERGDEAVADDSARVDSVPAEADSLADSGRGRRSPIGDPGALPRPGVRVPRQPADSASGSPR